MSSWIPSLFNPFADEDDPTPPEPTSPNNTTPRSPSSGAKDDLSAVFRGFASFLVSPQKTSLSVPSSSETIAGIKNDLAEIQGSFRSGLSLISSKFTSNLMQFQDQFNNRDEYDELEEEEGLGISEEVLDFVLKISRRPELWTDFPLSLPDDFDMSDYQREHAASIENLVPEFETVRQKIFSQMSEGKFWLIYFILLLPWLDEEDLNLLSSPQVAEARETLLRKLQHKTDEDQETSQYPESSDTKQTEIVNQSAISLDAPKQTEIINETGTGNHQSDVVDSAPTNDSQKQLRNEEDVSFSDLEDNDDDDDDPSGKLSALKVSMSKKGWFPVDKKAVSEGANEKADERALKDKESEGEDSNDWLTVNDTDFDNLAEI